MNILCRKSFCSSKKKKKKKRKIQSSVLLFLICIIQIISPALGSNLLSKIITKLDDVATEWHPSKLQSVMFSFPILISSLLIWTCVCMLLAMCEMQTLYTIKYFRETQDLIFYCIGLGLGLGLQQGKLECTLNYMWLSFSLKSTLNFSSCNSNPIQFNIGKCLLYKLKVSFLRKYFLLCLSILCNACISHQQINNVRLFCQKTCKKTVNKEVSPFQTCDMPKMYIWEDNVVASPILHTYMDDLQPLINQVAHSQGKPWEEIYAHKPVTKCHRS